MSVTPNRTSVVLLVTMTLMAIGAAGPARSEIQLLKGQTLYVPAYSHIYHGDREVPFDLTVTLSIRNTDPDNSITVVSADYYDSQGKLIRHYAQTEVKLAPRNSTRFVIKQSDRSGGSGASFVVKWQSSVKVTPPLVETVMISTATQQGISFTSRSQPIREEN